MPSYEYKVVPAPSKGRKARGVRSPEDRFALSVETVLNEMGEEGWEYLRAELLPSDERSGLTGTVTNWRNVLVFRRLRAEDAGAFQPQILEIPTAPPDPAPAIPPPVVGMSAADAASGAPAARARTEPPLFATGAERMLKDNGVEELSDVAGMTRALESRAARKTAGAEDGTEGMPDHDGGDADKDRA